MPNWPTILLTGFEPFGGSPVNPSQQIVEALSADPAPGLVLQTALLPVDTRRVPAAIHEALATAQPSAVVMLGQAGSRAAISVERVAINVLDFDMPDNDGYQPRDEPIVPAGPAAYLATLPIKKIVQAIQKVGVPAFVSNTAGTYLCNQVLYLALHWAAQQKQNVPIGFIHVPSLPEQVIEKSNAPSMALSTSLLAIRTALETLVTQL